MPNLAFTRKRRCWLLRTMYLLQTKNTTEKSNLSKYDGIYRDNDSTDPHPQYEHVEKAPSRAAVGIPINLGSATTFSTSIMPYTESLDPNVDAIRLTYSTALSRLSLPSAHHRRSRNTARHLSEAVKNVKLLVEDEHTYAGSPSIESQLWPTEKVSTIIAQRLSASVAAIKACIAALLDCSCFLAQVPKEGTEGGEQDAQHLTAAYAGSIVAMLAHQSAQESIDSAVQLERTAVFACMSAAAITSLAKRISLSKTAIAIMKRVCKDSFETTSTAYLHAVRQRLQKKGIGVTKRFRRNATKQMSVSVSFAHDVPSVSVASVDTAVPGASVAVSVIRSAFSEAGRRRVVVVAVAVEPAGRGNASTVTDASEDEFDNLRGDLGSKLAAVVSADRSTIGTTSTFSGGLEALNVVHAVLAAIRKYGI